MTLDALVLELRHELAAGDWLAIHSRVVPSSPEPIQVSRWDVETGRWQPNWDNMIEVLDAGDGMAFSRRFEQRLDRKGVDALPLRSIEQAGWHCHTNHMTHCEADGCPPEGGPARTPICERIIVALVQLRQPIGQVAWREDRDAEEVYALAVQSLRYAAGWRHRMLHRYMRDATERERDQRVQCPLCQGRVILMRRPRGRVA